jgi:hypothetical protein
VPVGQARNGKEALAAEEAAHPSTCLREAEASLSPRTRRSGSAKAGKLRMEVSPHGELVEP